MAGASVVTVVRALGAVSSLSGRRGSSGLRMYT